MECWRICVLLWQNWEVFLSRYVNKNNMVSSFNKRRIVFESCAIYRSRGKKNEKKKECFRPGSNRGPCACEAHVITATLRKQL